MMNPKRIQILALSGGGYRGLFGAEFLSHCEAEFQSKCIERFDIIAGTSIGALLAAGLSASIPAETLSAMMVEHGPNIFKRSLFGAAQRLLHSAPYERAPLVEAIQKSLGPKIAKTRLSDFEKPLVIVAVNYTTSEAAIFRSRGVAGSAASRVSIEDAILASAAAPTFFPIKKIGDAEFIDGGLVANAPDMVALLEAQKHLDGGLDEIYQLSIGAASRRKGSAVHEKARAPGAISWVARRGLVESIMAAQEDLTLSQVRSVLRTRFVRIDQEPAENQVKAIKSLDLANQSATSTLKVLARQAWEEHCSDTRLRSFFVR